MFPRLTAAVVAVASLVGLTGAASSAATGPRPWEKMPRVVSTTAQFRTAQSNGIWLYGDSITRHTWAALAKNLAAKGVPVAVDAQSSIPSTPAVDRLAARVKTTGAPRVLVVALGTNNIARSTTTPASVPADIARVMRMVPRQTQVVWVNVYKDPAVVKFASVVPDTTAINKAIAAADRQHVNLTTVDWFTQAKVHRAAYLVDGIHTTAAGAAARNALIAKAVLSARARPLFPATRAVVHPARGAGSPTQPRPAYQLGPVKRA